jgi:hypothetical protein
VPEVSFPGDGQHGGQPLPGVQARDEAAGMPGDGPVGGWDECPEMPDGYSAGDWDEVPGVLPSDDFDLDAEAARFEADLAAGRVWVPAPEPWELEGPSATLALPDAARHVDLAELAAVVGPDGLACEVFDQERVAEPMAPGPVLAALIGQGGQQVGRLSPGQLVGMATAAGRVAAWASSCSWPRLPRSPGTGRRGRRRGSCRRAGARVISPPRNWRWSWSPRRVPPWTLSTWPRTCRPGCRPPGPGWRPG